MTQPAPGVYGTYHDLRPIKTRKVVQLIIEVPVELAPRVVEAFGWPNAHTEEVWLAVTRLEPEAVEGAKEATGALPKDAAQDGDVGRADRQSPPIEAPGSGEPNARTDQAAGSAPGRSRPSSDTARSRECGRFCNNKDFQAFLQTVHEDVVDAYWAEDDPFADAVRELCGNLKSRRELDTDNGAWQRWCGLVSDYRCWKDSQERKSMGEAGV